MAAVQPGYMVSNTTKDFMKNELLVALGAGVAGGLIGLVFGIWHNNKTKATGLPAVETDFEAGLTGLLVGLAIVAVAVFIMRSGLHLKNVKAIYTATPAAKVM
jgi:presenilin-like A22 family membrane protease